MKNEIKKLLESLGEDPNRPGLQRTPERVERSLTEMTRGYGMEVSDVVGQGVFDEDCSEMVLVKSIEFYSMCEHHMLPFFGHAHVGYIPDGRIIGLSKIPRIVDMYARRLQVQERLTTQIASALDEVLSPKGVAVVISASHLCMMARGVQKQGSHTVTSCMLGGFRSDGRTRTEFLDLVRSGGHI